MSLKAFHIFFIAVSALIALGIGAWGVEGYFKGDGVSRLAMGVGSLLAAGGLVVYGVRVREKLRDLDAPELGAGQGMDPSETEKRRFGR